MIVVFIRGCSPRPSIKNSKHPSSPSTRPRGQAFTFLDTHFGVFCRTVCKFTPKRGTKMASKMIPLCYSMALLGPSRGPRWETPEGLGPSRGPCMRGPSAAAAALPFMRLGLASLSTHDEHCGCASLHFQPMTYTAAAPRFTFHP